jgi:hypothetical protein
MMPALRMGLPPASRSSVAGHQPRLEAIELDAGVAQAGHPYFRRGADPQDRVDWQRQQIETAGQDILADVSSADHETLRFQLFQQLPVQQMDLSKVRLRGVVGNAGAVLYGGAKMCVTFHAETGLQVYPHPRMLAEPVRAGLTDGFDPT